MNLTRYSRLFASALGSLLTAGYLLVLQPYTDDMTQGAQTHTNTPEDEGMGAPSIIPSDGGTTKIEYRNILFRRMAKSMISNRKDPVLHIRSPRAQFSEMASQDGENMEKVDYGAFVKLCYTGRLENGIVFDKTDECKPLEIRVGDGSRLQGFENALIGMGLNEKKSFVIGPDEAYGDRDEKLERSFNKSSLQLQFEPFPGQVILFVTSDGKEFPAVVKFVNEKTVVADFNHPLAGKELVFDVEITEISEIHGDSHSRCSGECCCA